MSPLVQMESIEVVGVLDHNGAGKSFLIHIFSGAMLQSGGTIRIGGEPVRIASPQDARAYGIETIYQTLTLADHLSAPANLFLCRELLDRWINLDEKRVLAEAKQILHRLNPNFTNQNDPVSRLSGGQHQVIAIARAIYFDVMILIMDEPMAALVPSETAMVGALIKQRRAAGIGIWLISHDMDDVYELCDRVVVMNRGRDVGSHTVGEVCQDDILSLIIKGTLPDNWTLRNAN